MLVKRIFKSVKLFFGWGPEIRGDRLCHISFVSADHINRKYLIIARERHWPFLYTRKVVIRWHMYDNWFGMRFPAQGNIWGPYDVEWAVNKWMYSPEVQRFHKDQCTIWRLK